MKRITLMVVLVAAMTSIAGVALAHTPRIDRREARQHARIHAGVRSGSLTRGEAVRLRAGQRHIHRMEWRAKADGRVTVRERARINAAQNHENRAIWRLKHNGRSR
jgi:hypothetical protein